LVSMTSRRAIIHASKHVPVRSLSPGQSDAQ
jgi:hypothetical protein